MCPYIFIRRKLGLPVSSYIGYCQLKTSKRGNILEINKLTLNSKIAILSGHQVSSKSDSLFQDSRSCRVDPDKSELENSGFDGMSEEELLAAVLEMSKREASPTLSHEDDDKPTSSPDTGFAEDDIQEMPENQDPVETEKPKPVTEPGRFNENKRRVRHNCVLKPYKDKWLVNNGR